MKKPIDASFDVLTGRSEGDLKPNWSGHLLHGGVLPAIVQLKKDAEVAGFELAVASSYRGYQRQLDIWKGKVAGERAVLDVNESPVDVKALDDESLLWHILYWSALPGTSRHHWGTDLDVYDARALRESGQSLQLTVAECSQNGPLFDFHCWLDERLASDSAHGFFRPYAQDQGGVAMEPWHLSYRPVASVFQQAFDFSVFERLLSEKQWPLQDVIERHAASIFERYIQVSSNN